MARRVAISKYTPQHMYLNLFLEFDEDGNNSEIDAILFKNILVNALVQLHGDTGASIPLDVLRYDRALQRAIIRVAGSELVKVWTAVTFSSCYKSRRCRITAERVSPYLISLSTDSRNYVHQEAV